VREIGIRDLRDHLSQYLQDVRAGENLTITDRGRPIARLIPAQNELVARSLAPLLEAGKAHWSGGKPAGAEVEIKDGPLVSDYVVEDRR